MVGDMPRARPPYLHREITRHGATTWYVRKRQAPRIRLREPYGTPAFWAEYRAAIEGTPLAAHLSKPPPHSLAWAINLYIRSPAWAALKPSTRKQRGNILRAVVEKAGTDPPAAITPKAIRSARDRHAHTPHAANNFVKAMRAFFKWAMAEGLAAEDPTAGVERLAGRNEKHGFRAWTEEEVQRFETRWPLGTRERLAFDVLLYTGLRRGDATRLGRQHIRGDLITIRTEKTGEEVVIPLLPEPAASIAAGPTGDMTLIVTDRGTARVKEAFGNWFREICRAADCPGSAHGLRKLAASRLAEAGANQDMLKALFGWETGKMADHYTRAASKKRFAREAARLLAEARKRNDDCPHLGPGAGSSAETAMKSGA